MPAENPQVPPTAELRCLQGHVNGTFPYGLDLPISETTIISPPELPGGAWQNHQPLLCRWCEMRLAGYLPDTDEWFGIFVRGQANAG